MEELNLASLTENPNDDNAKAVENSFQQKQNPLEISLVIGKLLRILLAKCESVTAAEILSCRLINSSWNNEIIRLLKKEFHKRPLEMNKKEIPKFNEAFKNKLDDHYVTSFSWELKELNPDEDFSNFATIAKDMTQFYIFRHVIDVGNFDEIPYNFEIIPMQPNFFEELIFNYFPFLTTLGFLDICYKKDLRPLIFHTDEERMDLYNSCKLNSLQSINVKVLRGFFENGRMLLDEIVRISPKLENIRIELEDSQIKSDVHIYKTLKLISQKAPQVKFLALDYRKYGIKIEMPNHGDFEMLNLKSFELLATFDQNLENYKSCIDYISHSTPISKTVENLKLVIEKTRQSEFKWALEDALKIPPVGFLNVKSLHIEFQFVHKDEEEEGSKLFLIIQKNFPALENLKLRVDFIPFKLEFQEPMKKLKSLKLIDAKLGTRWSTLENFYTFSESFKSFVPNLVNLNISVTEILSEECEAKRRVLAYPYFVWMGQNWENLKAFKLSFFNLFEWEKGTAEENLGVSSVKDLSDAFGNFTTEKITRLKYSEILTYDFEKLKSPEKTIFVNWLKAHFPLVKAVKH